MSISRLVILDRDGVINAADEDYVTSVDAWRELPGSLAAIAELSAAGYTVAVASNQSCIGRGLTTRAVVDEINRYMQARARQAGGDIDRVEICPHAPQSRCTCRKPRPGLLLRLARHYGVGLEDVPVIGDSLRDLQAARAVAARPILVLTGHGQATLAGADAREFEVFADLRAAARALCAPAYGLQ